MVLSIYYHIVYPLLVLLHHAPVIGVSNVSGFGWKLDPATHCFPLVGRLPYNKVYKQYCVVMSFVCLSVHVASTATSFEADKPVDSSTKL